MISSCIFCKIIKYKLPADIIYEDNQVIVILDIDDVVKGHTLIIWKKHCRNASDLTSVEYTHFSQIFHLIETKLLKVLQKEKSIVLKTGGLVEHFHFHIYPIGLDTPWEMIQNMFNKRMKYKYINEEKKNFVNKMKS